MAKHRKESPKGLSDRQLIEKYEGHSMREFDRGLKTMIETRLPDKTHSKKSRKSHNGLPDIGKLPKLKL